MYVIKFELLHFVADLQTLLRCKYKVWPPSVFIAPKSSGKAFSSVEFIRVAGQHGRNEKWMVFIMRTFFWNLIFSFLFKGRVLTVCLGPLKNLIINMVSVRILFVMINYFRYNHEGKPNHSESLQDLAVVRMYVYLSLIFLLRNALRYRNKIYIKNRIVSGVLAISVPKSIKIGSIIQV